MMLRQMSWACDHIAEMLLISINLLSTWLIKFLKMTIFVMHQFLHNLPQDDHKKIFIIDKYQGPK